MPRKLGVILALFPILILSQQSSGQDLQEPLKKIYNQDGTYSYALPKGFDPDALVEESIVTWQYIGQASFSDNPTASKQSILMGPETEDKEDDLPIVMVKNDLMGRKWIASSINEEASLESRLAYNDEFPEDFDDGSKGFRPDNLNTEEWWSTPMSWSHYNCDNSGGLFTPNETHIWDGDGRTRKTPSQMTNRQKASVRVYVDAPGLADDSSCSGALVRQRWVLTAAHCIWNDGTNDVHNLSDITVERYDIGYSIAVHEVHNVAGYSGVSNVNKDWALIELDHTWVDDGKSSVMVMGLSQSSDGTIENMTNFHHFSFPGYVDNPNYSDSPEVCGDNSYYGWEFYKNQEYESPNALAKKVKVKMDITSGQSGGPIFFCPGGSSINVCDVGETGMIFAVASQYDSTGNRLRGPKVPYFRSDALDVINSHPAP